MRAKGFTLLEVLIVVLIAATVAVFSVPAYKKTQEQNQFLAAQGILDSLGSAVLSMRADLSSQGVSSFPSSASVKVLNSWQTAGTDYTNAYNKEFSQLTNTGTTPGLGLALFAKQYMAPIPYTDATNSVYKGYVFYVCNGTADSNTCCVSNAVACIKYNLTKDAFCAAGRATENRLWAASYNTDGTISQQAATCSAS